MNLKLLREEVLEANLEIVKRGLVLYTFGNASGFDPESRRVVIKPSGSSLRNAEPQQFVVTDLDGNILEGDLRPSSDLPTHLALYRAFEGVHGVIHTHSRYATAWAQAAARHSVPGDHARRLSSRPHSGDIAHAAEEIQIEYELNTGHAIIRRFRNLNPLETPGVLVAGHAPFTGDRRPPMPHTLAVIVEETRPPRLFNRLPSMPSEAAARDHLRDKHFLRKHGATAYYGQPS